MSLGWIVESSAVGGVRRPRAANAEEPTGYRERLPIEAQDHHAVNNPRSSWSRMAREPIGCQRISTGPGGDCEARFFPDDSDVSTTASRPISSERCSEVDQLRCRS